jgi:hypothetical protein
MPVAFFIVLDTQKIVQGDLGERHSLIHGIKIIRIHGSHQLANEPETSVYASAAP